MSIDVPDTLDLSGLRATGQQPGEELLPEVAPPPLMTPDVEVKGILGSHGNEEDDSLYSPLLCQSVISALSLLPLTLIRPPLFPSVFFFSFSAFSVLTRPSVAFLKKKNIFLVQNKVLVLFLSEHQFKFTLI